MKRWRGLLPLLVLLALGLALLASGVLNRFDPQHWNAEQLALRATIAAHPWSAAMIYLGVLSLVVATGIPASVLLTVSAGMLFGLVEASALNAAGMLCGSLLLFAASRLAFGPSRGRVPELVERIRRGYLYHPRQYTLFVRLAPGMPWGGVTAALAWLRCPLPLFVVATSIGALVMAGIESSIGSGLGHTLLTGGKLPALDRLLIDPRILLPLAALALLALTPLLLGRITRSGSAGRGPA